MRAGTVQRWIDLSVAVTRDEAAAIPLIDESLDLKLDLDECVGLCFGINCRPVLTITRIHADAMSTFSPYSPILPSERIRQRYLTPILFGCQDDLRKIIKIRRDPG